MSIKISITDDHLVVLKGVEQLFTDEKNIDVISTSTNAKETLANLEDDEPDILLLDINLPDINGIELAKTIRLNYENIKIIALSNHEDIAFVKQMVKNGADGYLLKNTGKDELLLAIETVLKGEQYFQKALQQRLFNASIRGESNYTNQPKLTLREKEVLAAIYEELTTQEISDKLCISPKTVEVHRANIMSKLGAKNSIGIIKIALEKNLI